jgi:hypothetical protein
VNKKGRERSRHIKIGGQTFSLELACVALYYGYFVNDKV